MATACFIRLVRPLWFGLALALTAPLMAQAATRTTQPQTPQQVRADEIAICLPDEARTWPDGHDRPAVGGQLRLLYRHAGAPAQFDEAQVLGAVQRAAQAWSGCGVPVTVVAEAAAALHPASMALVQWSDAEARGNFALADLGRRRLSISPAMFALLAQRNPRHPAFQTLQMAVSHEMGHFLGLMAHSRRCVDVMSAYDNGQGQACQLRPGGQLRAVAEYRALLPTACDIARCRAVNGLAH